MLVTQSILEQENKKESVEKEVLYFAYFLVKIECRRSRWLSNVDARD